MCGGSARGLTALALATVAVALAAGFTAWALTAPVYSSGRTILEANDELSVRLALAAPLFVTSGVWLLLHAACRSGASWARNSALATGWLLLAFAFVSVFSIGMMVLPIALLVLAAAQLTPV